MVLYWYKVVQSDAGTIVELVPVQSPVSGHSGKSWPAIVIYFRPVVLKYYTGGVEMK